MKTGYPFNKIKTVTARFEFSQNAGTASHGFFIDGDSNPVCCDVVKKDETWRADSFAKFANDFIHRIQEQEILPSASRHGVIIAPENYIQLFWTPDFIVRLGDAIRRQRKNVSEWNTPKMKLVLRGYWNTKKFKMDEMTRKELAAFLNKTFYFLPPITPAAAWQMFYRGELFSKRKSGPKPREQLAAS
jgi:hypothetical protein